MPHHLPPASPSQVATPPHVAQPPTSLPPSFHPPHLQPPSSSSQNQPPGFPPPLHHQAPPPFSSPSHHETSPPPTETPSPSSPSPPPQKSSPPSSKSPPPFLRPPPQQEAFPPPSLTPPSTISPSPPAASGSPSPTCTCNQAQPPPEPCPHHGHLKRHHHAHQHRPSTNDTQPGVRGDPHLIGKHGERFDFLGKAGKSYCLVSDKALNINMKLVAGYRKHTTYITQLGIILGKVQVLISADKALRTPGKARDVMLGEIDVNGVLLASTVRNMTIGELELRRSRRSVRLVQMGLLDVEVEVKRVVYWKGGPQEFYLNVNVDQLQVSAAVHGVLGQTYRKAATLGQQHRRRHHGAFTIEGTELDYRTDNVLAAGCRWGHQAQH
eukprot:SM000084S23132  [mRNA]  locus=s84:319130:320731:+ [translate_table: standard]